MRIYLDNCCFNRPFDDQSGIKVKLETDAKLFVQATIRSGRTELAWSYILDFENQANPFFERRYTIEKWKDLCIVDIEENERVLATAREYLEIGIKPKDALHVACAIEANCEYFLTTDVGILKKFKNSTDIKVLDPIEFINVIEKQW